MKKAVCPQCGLEVRRRTEVCPRCGGKIDGSYRSQFERLVENKGRVERNLEWGYEYRSEAEIFGWPVIHVAIGKDADTGKIITARGIIAIGQFAVGLITIAQFGIGFLFGFGQFVGGIVAVGQFAAGLYFGVGQFATGITAIGQLALGQYVLAQIGLGQHIWSTGRRDPAAVEYFTNLWRAVRGLVYWQ